MVAKRPGGDSGADLRPAHMKAAARLASSRIQLPRLKGVVSRGAGRIAFKRRLPPGLGGATFLASTEGGLKYLRVRSSEIDPILTGFASRYIRRGSVVWDVGANVGLFAYAAAGLAGPSGRVLAIEPDTWLVEHLRRSRKYNDPRLIASVDVLPVAISDAVAVGTFHIARNNRATNYLHDKGSSVTGGSRESQLVPTFTLDQLSCWFPKPDVVKIDVEGAELEVLRGAERLLQRERPILLIEVDHPEEATDTLRRIGYRLFDAAANWDREVPRAAYNTIATPLREPPSRPNMKAAP